MSYSPPSVVVGILDMSEINEKKILHFWLPLALTWMLMAIEGPVIAGFIARMPDSTFNLAAFGIAFAFALIFESPVIMLMSASTALVKNAQNYKKMLNFTHLLNAFVLTINLVALLDPVFQCLASLLNLQAEVAAKVHSALFYLLPWPAAIGYRRFLQGVLIANAQTRKIAIGTLLRLMTMAIVCIFGYRGGWFEGAQLGAVALSAAVLCEGLFIYFISRPVVARLLAAEGGSEIDATNYISYKQVFSFYTPLAMTSLIALASQPMITFFVGYTRSSVESLAVLPVLNSFIFLFKCIGISYQEVCIALMGNKRQGFAALHSFALKIASFFILILFVIAFTPLGDLWFNKIAGLDGPLLLLTELPLKIMVFLPGISVMFCWQRAVAIYSKSTKIVTKATIYEVSAMSVVMLISVYANAWNGVIAAAMALTVGRIVSFIYMIYSQRSENASFNR